MKTNAPEYSAASQRSSYQEEAPQATPPCSTDKPDPTGKIAATSNSMVKKKAPQRMAVARPHASSLTYEKFAQLASACTTEQKIVFVARQSLGPGKLNGFFKCTSTMQQIKRQRVRARKNKELGGSTKDEEEDRLKLETFNPRIAKRMHMEMTQGLQYCNMMSDIIRTILEDIDPLNPVLLVQPPTIASSRTLPGTKKDEHNK
jgi:hypothetical protein